jgi:uncharacterized protein
MHDATMRERLSQALREALKGRDTIAVSALRSALSAIANAEAVDAPAVRLSGSQFVVGGVSGLGGDVPRRSVSDADVDTIVRAEIDERLRAADEYDRADRPEQADRLRREAGVLTDLVAPG